MLRDRVRAPCTWRCAGERTVSARAQSAAVWLPTTWIVPGLGIGPSSGGFFALQQGVSFSSVFKGVGISPAALRLRRPEQLHGLHVQRNTGHCAVDRET